MERYQQRIALTNARFFAYHGFYPEEQVLGTEFILDIECFIFRDFVADDELDHTLNYAELYQIAKKQMEQPRKLLETVVKGILIEIKESFPEIDLLRINIRKTHPPFGGDLANTEVGLFWEKETR